MTKRIVTGVDDSETAAAAARTAARLADALGAELHVVSAFGRHDLERFTVGNDEFVHSSEEDALNVARQVVVSLRQAYPGLTIHPGATVGAPAEAIVQVAEELDADLIVIGNKRVQGMARVLGSIANDVVHKAHCDVYVAHTHGPHGHR